MGIGPGASLIYGESNRNPPVTERRAFGFHTSCRYTPSVVNLNRANASSAVAPGASTVCVFEAPVPDSQVASDGKVYEPYAFEMKSFWMSDCS